MDINDIVKGGDERIKLKENGARQQRTTDSGYIHMLTIVK